MPDIVLKNKNGESVTYEGIETVTFDTPTEERGATFIHGTPVENVPVELDLADGNQTVTVPDGYFAKSAVIQKPESLTPENIKLGVDIAGVVGELVGTGVEETVDLDFSEGSQVVTPPEGTLYSQVTINKPEELVPENIAKGVTIGGIVGTMIAPSFDVSDPNLRYFSYCLDAENELITLYQIFYDKIYEDTGTYNFAIPDTIGAYSVVVKAV